MGSDGITTGLKFWLLFFLGFALVGYPPGLSVILGFIGGVATGWLKARWYAKNQMGSLEGAETPWQTTQRRFQQFKSQVQSRVQRPPRTRSPKRPPSAGNGNGPNE